MQTHTGIWRGIARRARAQVTEVDWMGWRGYEEADGGGQRSSGMIFFFFFSFLEVPLERTGLEVFTGPI